MDKIFWHKRVSMHDFFNDKNYWIEKQICNCICNDWKLNVLTGVIQVSTSLEYFFGVLSFATNAENHIVFVLFSKSNVDFINP